jgi:hypothetical protein
LYICSAFVILIQNYTLIQCQNEYTNFTTQITHGTLDWVRCHTLKQMELKGINIKHVISKLYFFILV